MKASTIAAILIGIAVLTVIAYAYLNNVTIILPPPSKPSYLIIADDSLVDAKLQEYITARSITYSVTLTKLSQIPSGTDTREFLTVTNIESITYTGGAWDALYLATNDITGYYQTVATATNTGFTVNMYPWKAVELCPLVIGYAGTRTFTITHDGGQTITVTMTGSEDYTWWGHARITLNGQIAFKHSRADDIRDYIDSTNAKDVLLIGGPNLPGFNIKNIMIGYTTIGEGMTDHPYLCQNIYTTNKDMTPSIAVARIPARTTTELDTALTKFLAWQPKQTGKALMWQTYEDDTMWNNLKTSLQTSLPTLSFTALAYPTADAVTTALNSENDLVIAFTHGDLVSLQPLPTNFAPTINYQKSNFIWTISCWTGDFSSSVRSPGENFILANGIACCGYFGSPTPPDPGEATKMCIAFFSSSGTLGNRFIQAQTGNTFFGRLDMNFFGDPALTY